MEMLAPMPGLAVPLSTVDDPVFAEGIAGDGVAIVPEAAGGGSVIEVLAPVAGTLARLFEGGHAFAIEAAGGIEMIVHIGLDTIELKGDGFELIATEGDLVEAGQPIVRADLDRIKEAGYDPVTPVIVMNSDEHPVAGHRTGAVKPGDVLFTVA